MGKGNKTSRRQFLENSGRAALMMTAFDTIFGSLMQSQIARAATVPGLFKKFIHVNIYASPPRWMYDLFLNPTNEANLFLPSKHVGNFFKADSATAPYTSTGFRQTDWGGTFVPHLWSRNVALSGGRTVKAGSLLDNMLSVRGIDVLNAAHAGANNLHQAGIVGAPTLGSVTADQSSVATHAKASEDIVKALILDPNQGSIFNSAKNLAAFSMSTSATTNAKKNNLVKLFGSLQPMNSVLGANSAANREALQAEISAAMKSLDPAARYYYSNLNKNRDAAIKILTDQTITVFDSLAADWTPLFNKYMDNIARTLAMAYPGIDDRPIGEVATGATLRMYQVQEGKFLQTKVSGKVDIRSILSTVDYSRLAAQFATVEFLVRNDLCPSIALTPSPFDDLTGDLSDGTDFSGRMVFDQHFWGTMVGTYVNTKYWLAYTSCMLELVGALKDSGTFGDTLIYMNTEFNRSARVDGSGADHGAEATSVSLISGRIPKFKIIGNIYKDSGGEGTRYGSGYKGTWGHGAPINGKALDIQHFWGSIMALLGTPLSELPNILDRSRLIFKTAGSFAVTSGFDVAKNIVNNSK